jgi:flagellar basal-body rod protein FlgB
MRITTGDQVTAALHTMLERQSARVSAVAANLANVDTPRYRAMDVAFPEPGGASGLELRRTDSRHLSPGADEREGHPVQAPVTRLRADGNTVDIDREMTLLAALRGRYRAAAGMVRKRFALRLYAAVDGRSGT